MLFFLMVIILFKRSVLEIVGLFDEEVGYVVIEF
jgi:hypothetical protein